MSAAEIFPRLRRTINFAHTLDAVHQGRSDRQVCERDFMLCRDAGFSAVRMPIQFVEHLSKNGTISSAMLQHTDWLISTARRHGFAIVLANHLDAELMADPTKFRGRLMNIWMQLATRYRNEPADLAFEPLAEPIGKLNEVWNDVLSDVLAVIRRDNPTRAVVAGPTHYNNMRFLNSLAIPNEDRNLVVSIHHYYPVEFTMQGEMWLAEGEPEKWLGNRFLADEPSRALFANAFAGIATWAKLNDRPIFMGEFGATSNADINSRVEWTMLSRALAESHGFAWGYWAFSHTFELYDERGWNESLLRALMPASP